MSPNTETIWLRYRTRAKRELWHAWTNGQRESICGYVRLGPRIIGRADCQPKHDCCQLCLELLRRATRRQVRPPAPSVKSNRPRSNNPHIDARNCACTRCRVARTAGAERFLDQVNQEVESLTCSCIRRILMDEWETRQLCVAIQNAETELAQHLMLWELTGDGVARSEAHDSRLLLLDQWDAACDLFDRRGENHICGRDNPGSRTNSAGIG